MSMSFINPINEETAAAIRDLCGEPVAHDERTFLFDGSATKLIRAIPEISRKAKQSATVESHSEGAIHTMSDGTRYQVTPKGWQKIS